MKIKLPKPEEPSKEHLRNIPETIYVLSFSGDWEDLPAVMKLSEYCKDWCPLRVILGEIVEKSKEGDIDAINLLTSLKKYMGD